MKLKEFFNKIRANQEPSREFHDKLKESLAVYMKSHPPLPKATFAIAPRRGLGRTLAVSFAALVILCTGATMTVSAAQKALPGDAFYGIKLAVDQLSVAIANSPEARINVADRRLAEVKQVLASQSGAGNLAEADVKIALQQYQSNLQEVMVSMSESSSTSSTVQGILQKTVENERDLEQMVRESSGTALNENLANSLQFSRQTVEAAHVALGDSSSGTGSDNSGSDTPGIKIPPIHSAPSTRHAIPSSNVSFQTIASSTYANDVQKNGTGDQATKEIPYRPVQVVGQTETATSTPSEPQRHPEESSQPHNQVPVQTSSTTSTTHNASSSISSDTSSSTSPDAQNHSEQAGKKENGDSGTKEQN